MLNQSSTAGLARTRQANLIGEFPGQFLPNLEQGLASPLPRISHALSDIWQRNILSQALQDGGTAR